MESKGTFQGWIASLSNGETVFEGQELAGEPTPWQQLITRCKNEHVSITQIRLQLGGLTLIGTPNADGYCHCWEQHMDLYSKNTRLYRGIGSVFGEKVYLTWIDVNGNIRQEIRDLSSMQSHCAMK